MTVRAPLFIGSVSHSEGDVRLGLSALFGLPTASVTRPSGVIPGYGGMLAVTQAAAPGMTVQVASGAVHLGGTVSPTQGNYPMVNDAAVNLSVQSSHPTLPRVDIVVARVKDDDYGDPLLNVGGYLEVVTGTPNATRTVPATPANALKLAEVDVAANSTAVLNSNVVDLRTWTVAVGGCLPCKSTTRPDNPYPGMKIYEVDTGFELIWTGTVWKYSPARPIAMLLSRSSAQSIPNTTLTGISWTIAFKNIGGLTPALPATTITIPAGYAGFYLITAYVPFASDANGAQRVLQLEVNGTPVVEARDAPITAATIPTPQSICTGWNLDVGNTVRVAAYHDAGNALNTGGIGFPRLSMTRLVEE